MLFEKGQWKNFPVIRKASGGWCPLDAPKLGVLTTTTPATGPEPRGRRMQRESVICSLLSGTSVAYSCQNIYWMPTLCKARLTRPDGVEGSQGMFKNNCRDDGLLRACSWPCLLPNPTIKANRQCPEGIARPGALQITKEEQHAQRPSSWAQVI